MNSLLQMHGWILQIFSILLVSFLVTWLGQVVYHRLLLRFEKKHHIWDVAFIRAIQLPYIYLVWLIALSAGMVLVLGHVGMAIALNKYVYLLRELLLLSLLLWVAIRFINYLEDGYLERARIAPISQDPTTISAVSHLARIVIIVILLLIGMQTVGVEIATLLTFGGVGGIVIGFAAKDTIANLIGGMMIYWDRPFSVGELVRSPDREIEGTVEGIGWRLTRIRTIDQRPLYVPNGIFSTIILENPSRMSNRRIRTIIGLRYQDAPFVALLLNEIMKLLGEHPGIDSNLTYFANLVEFGPTSLNIKVSAYTRATEIREFQEIQQSVLLKIIDIVTSHGAEFALPTQTVIFKERDK